MKNGHLLIGLGLSAVVGATLGYFFASEKKDVLMADLHHLMSDLQGEMKDVCAKIKSKAEEKKEEVTSRVERVVHPSENE